jgi:hypothetical protein
LLRKATALGAVFFLLSAETLVSAEELAAHHATYILSLAPDNKNSQITGAEGLMVYDLKNVCDGWATELKLKFVMSLDSGENRDFETSQVTWEAKDGSAFRYTIKNSYGGGPVDQLRGEVRIDAGAGGKATVTSDLPTRAEGELPAGVLFPISHTRELLKKAADGESVFTTEFFDGTNSTEAMEVSALIGVGEKDWAGLSKPFPALAGKTSYPIGLAFYSGTKGDGVPDTEQVVRLYENGIVGMFNLPLGSIKIRAVLDSVDLKPDSGC